jgi:hypothetical protein
MTVASPAPVALFAYRRPEHLQAALSALAANTLAGDTSLTIFCDGPRTATEVADVEAVRSLARRASGFREVHVVVREENLGLAGSLIRGVSTMLADHDRVIVLEDDILTSPHFLTYMNQALERYQEETQVWCIHGYQFPVKQPLPDTFFLRGAECWGWATWRRAWQGFESDGSRLLDTLKQKNLVRAFNLDGGYDYYGLLAQQAAGKVDSWAIRWRASAFVQGGLCLWPGRSLVKNIGHDSSGEHCADTARFDAEPSRTPVPVSTIPLQEDLAARDALRDFFICTRPSLGRRIGNLIRRGLEVLR